MPQSTSFQNPRKDDSPNRALVKYKPAVQKEVEATLQELKYKLSSEMDIGNETIYMSLKLSSDGTNKYVGTNREDAERVLAESRVDQRKYETEKKNQQQSRHLLVIKTIINAVGDQVLKIKRGY